MLQTLIFSTTFNGENKLLSTFFKHIPHDDHLQVQSQLRTLQAGCEAYYADQNRYPDNLDELVPEFIVSYKKRWSTGNLVYYVSTNKQYCSTWEERNRIVNGLPGRYVIDNASLTFKTQSEFESFIGEIPN